MPRAAQDRSSGGSGDEERPGEHERDTEDERSRFSHDPRKPTAECPADLTSVALTQRDHQPDQADRETGAERAQVDDLAADEH
ncbi:MAG: hypothetical protein M5U27_02505 [Gaiella sp.]|nr:hypothetical protein [Gaiella sp.]